MIIDEKTIMQPPPPYRPSALQSRPTHRTGHPPSLAALPAHILLLVVYNTIPQSDLADQPKPARQRKALYWISTSLRLVCRTFYVACMHVLRSTYLPAYDMLVRPPYSSDPFPLLSPGAPGLPAYDSSSASLPNSHIPLQTIQRETSTLDRFIALKVREDVWADDSELHLERDESFKDLFELVQPRSRLEDLVRTYGLREGVVTLDPPVHLYKNRSSTALRAVTSAPSPPVSRTSTPQPHQRSSSTSQPPPQQMQYQPTPQPRNQLTSFFSALSFSKSRSRPPPPAPSTTSSSSSSSTSRSRKINPIPFALLSVSFSTRKVGLILASAQSASPCSNSYLPPSSSTSGPSGAGVKRTIVETTRTRDERLENAAKRLVKELRAWLLEDN